ncbi:MAG: hypothetical protein FWD13_09765, partial [Treponema sp.]|nr:hypothetical protein [Treponema sp.]
MGQPTTIGVEMGGFAGRASGWEGVELENCWSKGDVNSWGAGSLYTGGLLGRTTNVKLTGCWAEGNISAYSLSTGRYDFFTGGLVGASVNTDISESRASGSVTAMTDVFSNLNIDVGGLVGSSMGGSIKNSYAEGNVSAVNQRNSPANIRAGGLIGHATNYFTTPHREIEFNFARGLVSAQSGGSGNVHAGGIIGLIDSGSITNNIALNRDVLALGGSNRVAARVYANTGTYSGSSNYSRSDMRLTT